MELWRDHLRGHLNFLGSIHLTIVSLYKIQSLLRHHKKFASRTKPMYQKRSLYESPTTETTTHPVAMRLEVPVSYIRTPVLLTHSLTQTAAIPIPVPTHILVTPIFFPVRPNSLKSVATCLAPVQPKGCPNAIAPPFGLT